MPLWIKKDEKVITRVNIFIYKMQTRILIRARPHQWFVTIRRRLSPIVLAKFNNKKHGDYKRWKLKIY